MTECDGFLVECEEVTDGYVLRPIGDVDLSCSPRLRHAIAVAQEKSPIRLIIDLDEVPYMDSSGVATLVEAMQIARRNRTKLVLCSMKEKVRAIFEIARLDMVFTIADDREEALGL